MIDKSFVLIAALDGRLRDGFHRPGLLTFVGSTAYSTVDNEKLDSRGGSAFLQSMIIDFSRGDNVCGLLVAREY